MHFFGYKLSGELAVLTLHPHADKLHGLQALCDDQVRLINKVRIMLWYVHQPPHFFQAFG
jgi:hypothetical protein